MSTHASNIRTVLDALAASEFAARVRVFGSVMKGDQTAGDVDCVIDCDGTWDPAATFHRKYDGGGAIHSPLSSPAIAPLLDLAGDRSLCGSNGRHLLDLHVRRGPYLWVPRGSWWTVDPVPAGIWSKVCSRGVPLERIKWAC